MRKTLEWEEKGREGQLRILEVARQEGRPPKKAACPGYSKMTTLVIYCHNNAYNNRPQNLTGASI